MDGRNGFASRKNAMTGSLEPARSTETTTLGIIESRIESSSLKVSICRQPRFRGCKALASETGTVLGPSSGGPPTISVFILPAHNFDFLNLTAIYNAPIVGTILGLDIGQFLFTEVAKSELATMVVSLLRRSDSW
jgi:hypothetical protein